MGGRGFGSGAVGGGWCDLTAMRVEADGMVSFQLPPTQQSSQ